MKKSAAGLEVCDWPEAVARLLDKAASPHVVIGPLVWQPSDGTSARQWYFIVATGRADGMRLDQIVVGPQTAESDRWVLIGAMARSHPPRVLHVMDSELQAAQLVEALWPSPRATRLRETIQAEDRP